MFWGNQLTTSPVFPSDGLQKVNTKQVRPKTTWRRTVEAYMKDMGMTRSELEKKAKDREECKRLVLAFISLQVN